MYSSHSKLNKLFKLLILSLLFSLPVLAQNVTVTGTITDTQSTPYINGQLTISLVNTTGQVATFGGSPVFQQLYSLSLDSTGSFSISLPPNSTISPSILPIGTQWRFSYQSQGGYGAANINVTITGSGSISGTLSNLSRITWPTSSPGAPCAAGQVIIGINSVTNGCTSVPSSSGTNSFTGTVTVNNAAGSGANDLTIGIENQERMACSLAAPIGTYRFTTIVAAINDIKANGSGGGGIIRTCPGHVETTTSQTDIGCNNEASCGSLFYTVTILLYPGTIWTCNDTAGGTDACWNIHNGSALYGLQNGSQASGAGAANGGVKLEYACTAKTSYGVNTPEGSATSGGGQAYARMSNLIIEGCPTGTVAGGGSPSVAMLNIEGISEVNQWENLLVDRFANTIGIRVAGGETGSTAVLGPIVLTNVWSDGGYNTGALPWKIDATLHAILPVTINGGVCNHPGASLTCMTVVGNTGAGNGSSFRGLGIHGMYFENQQNGASTMLSLTNVNNVMIDHINMLIEGSTTGSPSADTAISIAEGSLGSTSLVDVDGMFVNIQGGGTCTMLTNSINSDLSPCNSTGTIQFLARYHYGNDNGYITGFTVSNNQIQVLHANQALLLKNLADSELDLDLNSSLVTAGRNSFIRHFDHTVSDTTPQMCSGMTGATHSWVLVEGNCSGGSTNYAIQDIPSTQLNFNAFGATGIEFNARANSVAPVRFFSGGAAPIETARIDGTGNIFLGCHITTFQNCTELSATTASGGASAAVITIPGTPGTACVSASPCSATTYGTATNCSSSASPAVCGSAAAGSVALPTNAVSSSIQVNTTAVTANSQIFAFADDTLGTKLGITCNSNLATLVGGLTISARTAGTSFTIANNVAVVTNALCVSYWIVN